ncbi:MAG TPA: NUDIX domain-containing protein [Candidatus Limnocylindrales bacterium]
MEPTPRYAARVVLLDESDRILLVRFHDPDTGKTWWATPGGSLEPGETHEAAARREMREETGLESITLGPCIWTREHEITIRGQAYLQTERIFLARVAHFEARATQLEELEQSRFKELRWWSHAELAAAEAELAPRSLAELLAGLLRDGPPVAPIAVGI